MAPLRKIYLVSLGILGLLLAATIYSIPGESTKYKEFSRSELIKTEKGWVIQVDLDNPEQNEEKYNISVQVDGNDSDVQDALIEPESNFRYSYGTMPEEGRTVKFKIYRESGGTQPSVQEFQQKI